jgi:hypothetical protein
MTGGRVDMRDPAYRGLPELGQASQKRHGEAYRPLGRHPMLPMRHTRAR